MHPLFIHLGDRAALVPQEQEQEQQPSLIQLVASCMVHADKLNRLAQDLSLSECRVHQLLEKHQLLIQSMDAREHRYKEHVATYQQLLLTQERMLLELEEMLIMSNNNNNNSNKYHHSLLMLKKNNNNNAMTTTKTTNWKIPSIPSIVPSSSVLPLINSGWWKQWIMKKEPASIVSQQQNELGHTTDIVIAGTCVTAEPNLVPKVFIYFIFFFMQKGFM